jgi:hypothetical protein
MIQRPLVEKGVIHQSIGVYFPAQPLKASYNPIFVSKHNFILQWRYIGIVTIGWATNIES